MRFGNLALLVTLAAYPVASAAQNNSPAIFGLNHGQIPATEISLGYSYFHGNAPPAGCGCFSLNGGGGSLIVNAEHGWSLVADLSAAHANAINHTTQSITIFNYLAGPRYSYRSAHRLTPYVQTIVGGAEELSNYAYVRNVNAFGASAGGGVTTTLSRRIGWNIVQADWVFSKLPNAQNNRQNDLRISSGILFRFGPR